jgi:DNA-binding CsgD family transcriptional regulator
MTAIASGPRSAVFAASRRGGARLDGTLSGRVRDLRADVGDALGMHPAALRPADPSQDGSPDDMAGLAGGCMERAAALSEVDGVRARRLCLLALDLQQLALDLYQYDLGVRTNRLAECSDGLARLRTLPSSGDLLDTVCAELVWRCGFGRAVLSRVEGRFWKPASAFFTDDDGSWFSGWVDQGIALTDPTPETRLLSERRPAVVYDTERATVHRPIIVESGQSKSYVVAPLMHGGIVVGFLHADHSPSDQQADGVDRDVLWAFAEGFSRIYERTVLMERVRAQRDQVGMILSSALHVMSELGEPSAESGTIETLPDLTSREAEVLHLMVGGATNRAIAARLVIAEDTVKSHVKHILRKLGVANRSQAIARAAGTAPPGILS